MSSSCLLVLLLVAGALELPMGARGWGWLHESLFDDAATVIDLTSGELSKLHTNAVRCPWVVLYYDSMCGHCRAYAPAYASESSSHYDAVARDPALSVVLFGAVNCAAHEAACSAAEVSSVPVLFVGRPRTEEETPDSITLLTPRADGALATDPAMRWRRLDVVDDLEAALVQLRKTVAPTATAAARSSCHSILEFAVAQKRRALASGDKQSPDSATPLQPAAVGNRTNVASFAQHHSGGDAFVEETRLHVADVGGALFTTLWHEVPMATAAGDTVEVLSRFLDAVDNSLPHLRAGTLRSELLNGGGGAVARRGAAPKSGANLLRDRAAWRGSVAAAGIPHDEQQAEADVNATASAAADEERAGALSVVWRMCRGSSWKERGLPCGLWALYHAVVANAHHGAAARALHAIADYVAEFFTCAECRQHFAAMVHEMPLPPISSRDDDAALLWIWRAHNQVNARLARDGGSSDPKVPKIQWPPQSLCGNCRRSSESAPDDAVVKWDLPRVATFVRQHYAWRNLVPLPRHRAVELPLAEIKPQRRVPSHDASERPGVVPPSPPPPTLRSAADEGPKHEAFVAIIFICVSVALAPLVFVAVSRTVGQWIARRPRAKFHDL